MSSIHDGVPQVQDYWVLEVMLLMKNSKGKQVVSAPKGENTVIFVGGRRVCVIISYHRSVSHRMALSGNQAIEKDWVGWWSS